MLVKGATGGITSICVCRLVIICAAMAWSLLGVNSSKSMNQWWHVKWTLRNTLQWNSSQNKNLKNPKTLKISAIIRDQSVHAPCQWEMALHCNSISHWLGSYTEWSLHNFSGGNELSAWAAHQYPLMFITYDQFPDKHLKQWGIPVPGHGWL